MNNVIVGGPGGHSLPALAGRAADPLGPYPPLRRWSVFSGTDEEGSGGVVASR